MIFEKERKKEFWEGIRNNKDYKFLIDDVLDQYKVSVSGDMPALKYSEFKLYSTTGSREEYERSYFIRRKRLNTSAILCLIYPENEEYLEKLQDTLWTVCNEYTWALPAHVTHTELSDANIIDLFAAETGFALSEIKYFLGERLDDIINKRISYEIERRIIQPYLTRTFCWNGGSMNWTAVCGGSVGMTVMYENPELFKNIESGFDKEMKGFLSGYKADGVCREGLAYWDFGFGFFEIYADALRQFTNGEKNYFKDQHVKECAKFAQKVFMTKNIVVSFADGSMIGSYGVGNQYLLKKMYPDTVEIPDGCRVEHENCARWCTLLRAFLFYDSSYEISKEIKNQTYYMKESNWFLKKAENYSFAAKGGDNDEPHNHNDIGVFIIAKDGRQIICDIGAGIYNKANFSEQRYDIFCNSSLSHSVPIIDGQPQLYGSEYCGELSYDNDIVKIDFAKAYDVKELKTLIRKFSFTENSISMEDHFEFSGENIDFTERMVTMIKPVIYDGYIIIGEMKTIYDSIKWNVSVSTRKHVKKDVTEDVYCIDFTQKEKIAAVFKAEFLF